MKFSKPNLSNIPAFIEEVEISRRKMPELDWRQFVATDTGLKMWRYLLCLDPYTRWGLLKPKGYAGDARVMDFAYRHDSVQPEVELAGEVGQHIYSFTSGSRQSQSARERVDYLAEEIRSFCEGKSNVRIASYASGHGREFDDLDEQTLANISEVFAIDSDPTALEELHSSHPGLPLQCISRNVFRYNPGPEAFDLVYSLGLFDYLTLKQAKFLLGRMLDHLRPGGKVIIANLDHAAGNIGYCEAVMDWWMITKSEEQMASIPSTKYHPNIKRIGCFNYLTLEK